MTACVAAAQWLQALDVFRAARSVATLGAMQTRGRGWADWDARCCSMVEVDDSSWNVFCAWQTVVSWVSNTQSSTTSNNYLFVSDWWSPARPVMMPTHKLYSFVSDELTQELTFWLFSVFRWEIQFFGRTKNIWRTLSNVTICCFQVICLQKPWVVNIVDVWCLSGSAAAVLYSAAVAAYETVAQWPFALDLLQAIPALPGRKALMGISCKQSGYKRIQKIHHKITKILYLYILNDDN